MKKLKTYSFIAIICTTLLGILFSSKSLSKQSNPQNKPEPIEVMVIGLDHFANPGQDLINVEVASVLTSNKQKELADIAEKLLRFKPTLVAVEEQTQAPEYIAKDYHKFKAEDLLSQPNEIVQVGYRLARLANLKNVYGIDEQSADGEPSYFPMDKFFKHLDETKQAEHFNLYFSGIEKQVEKFFANLEQNTLSQRLIAINQKDSPIISLEFYLEMLKYDQGEAQPGAEIFAYYMMRNTKIAAKLLDVAKPGDRVIVVYGAGHKSWLDFIFNNMPGVKLVDPIQFLSN